MLSRSACSRHRCTSVGNRGTRCYWAGLAVLDRGLTGSNGGHRLGYAAGRNAAARRVGGFNNEVISGTGTEVGDIHTMLRLCGCSSGNMVQFLRVSSEVNGAGGGQVGRPVDHSEAVVGVLNDWTIRDPDVVRGSRTCTRGLT